MSSCCKKFDADPINLTRQHFHSRGGVPHGILPSGRAMRAPPFFRVYHFKSYIRESIRKQILMAVFFGLMSVVLIS
jgi:hypothetical protein